MKARKRRDIIEGFEPMYMNIIDSSDSSYLDYGSHDSGLNEIFSSLESLKDELQTMKEPQGTITNPARSCRDLYLCHPEKPSGEYWIDPNGGSNRDAIKVECDMEKAGVTCISPEMNSVRKRKWTGENPGSWFSEYKQGGGVIGYNVTEPQFKFLRLLSSKAEQKFVLSCHNTVGWYDETTRDYSNALTMKSYDNTEVTYSPEETRFAIAEDSCSGKSSDGQVIVDFNTRDVDILPIVDFKINDENAGKYGYSISDICFYG